MQDQWSWVFSNFGITEIWERDHEDSGDGAIYQPTIKISTAVDLPDRPLVVLSPPGGRFLKGTVSLADFNHPEEAIYMFGQSHGVLSDDDMAGRSPDSVVFIPTVKHEMYSHTAAYVTLWDRYVKRGDFG